MADITQYIQLWRSNFEKNRIQPEEKFPDNNEIFKSHQLRMRKDLKMTIKTPRVVIYESLLYKFSLRQKLGYKVRQMVQLNTRVLMLRAGQIKKCLLHSK